MQPSSFHRRMLPWIFAIAFFAIAPIVLFYTSGYRWNIQKGRVEKSSTVILDSIPSRASIRIDGRNRSEKTPATIQNMAPGTHSFVVTKEGFHPWEKSLDARPELVTFANRILLWKKAEPERRFFEKTSHLSLPSPDARTLLRLSSTTPTLAFVTDAVTQNTQRLAFPHAITLPINSFWSNSGRFALLEPISTSGSRWLIDTQTLELPLELPRGRYRWDGEELIGKDGATRILLSPLRADLTRSTVKPGTADQMDDAELRVATNTDALVYTRMDQPHRGLMLPPGSWTIWSRARAYVLLRFNDTWLALQAQADAPVYHRAQGDILRPIPSTSRFRLSASTEDRFLLIHGRELWLWNPLAEPELLLRRSEPIVNAAWHHEGNDIFFATQTGVFALNLDPRNGYLITPLASFDHISDLAVAGDELFIAGTKNALDGVWTLTVQ